MKLQQFILVFGGQHNWTTTTESLLIPSKIQMHFLKQRGKALADFSQQTETYSLSHCCSHSRWLAFLYQP